MIPSAPISTTGLKPREVEVNLRIPRVKTPVRDADGYPIDNGSVRYVRRITVPQLPEAGTLLRLETSAGVGLECEVLRTDWDDRKEMFVVYGKYSQRSIPPDQYHALINDPDWEMRPLLSTAR